MAENVIAQAGVVPFRTVPGGVVDVLLIRRRPHGGWGIPKGLVDPGQTPRQAALTEAHEEAGLEGELLPHALGYFDYPKFGGTCRVEVFALRVAACHDHFLEEELRERRWFPWAQAVRLAKRRGVREVLRQLPVCLAYAEGDVG